MVPGNLEQVADQPFILTFESIRVAVGQVLNLLREIFPVQLRVLGAAQRASLTAGFTGLTGVCCRNLAIGSC